MEVVFKFPSFALLDVKVSKVELTEIIVVDLRARFSVNTRVVRNLFPMGKKDKSSKFHQINKPVLHSLMYKL